jgi:hypothetical protein
MTFETTPICTFKFITAFNYNVKWRLKAGLIELDQTSDATQRLGNTHYFVKEYEKLSFLYNYEMNTPL